MTVGESTGFGDFADLYKMTYERQGLPMPLAARAIEEVLRVAVGSGDARLFLARTALAEPAAGLLVGFRGERVDARVEGGTFGNKSDKSRTPPDNGAPRCAAVGRPDGAGGRRDGGAWFVLAASHPLHRKGRVRRGCGRKSRRCGLGIALKSRGSARMSRWRAIMPARTCWSCRRSWRGTATGTACPT